MAGAVPATHFPLHGEGGLVSSVEDLALWHAQFGVPARDGMALAEALAAMTPFANGAPNTYARGLRIKTWRGVWTIGHDGLWPGFKTSFVRLPDRHAAVICISNDASSDPHDLAFQVVDTLLEGAPGVHAVPPMPDWAAAADFAGRYLDRGTGATVDLGHDAQGRVTASHHGVATRLVPTEDGRLATSRGSATSPCGLTRDGLQVERDAGVRETLHRVAEAAHLPAGLPAATPTPTPLPPGPSPRRTPARELRWPLAADRWRPLGDRADRGRLHPHLHPDGAVSCLGRCGRAARRRRARDRTARRWRAREGPGVRTRRTDAGGSACAG